MANGYLGFDIQERSARFYEHGSAVLSTSTLDQVGRGVAKLLELPPATHQQYANRFVYVSSFHVSQMDVFHSLLKATGTQEKDWKVYKVPVDAAIAEGSKEFQAGNYHGLRDLMYGRCFKEGAGGNFKAKSDNGILRLAEEDLDEIVRSVVKKVVGA